MSASRALIERYHQRQEDMFCTLDWKEIGQDAPTPHRLRFWTRPLDV